MRLWETDDLDAEFDAIEALMQEDVVGENHGGSASRLIYRHRDDHDGEEAPSPRRSLNTATREARQFAMVHSATVVHRTDMSQWGASGWAPGERHRTIAPEEWADLDYASLRTQILDMLGGFTTADLETLNRTGRDTAAESALRVRFEDALLALVESNGGTGAASQAGSGTTLIARALGFPVNAEGDSKRLRTMLKKARRRRDAAAAVPA